MQNYLLPKDREGYRYSQLVAEDENGNLTPVKVDTDGKILTSTQLTGSIVELYKSDSVEMESNSRINLIDITEMKKKHVIASIRARDSHDFLLDVDWRTSATGSVGYSVGAEQLIKSDNELSSKTENYISTKTNVARFRLENNSDEIQRYLSIVIMGVD